MAQNIYDNPQFFEGYSSLRRSVGGLAEAPEWPSLRAMLPVLRGRHVLDLGCGFGWFCRWARQNGVASALGVDISEKMLARAIAMTDDASVTYEQADLERIELPRKTFSLVYSSLVFHYIVDLERLFDEIYRALVPGGSFVFSVEHPIYTAPAKPGWLEDDQGRKTWPIDGYSLEGPRTTDWLAKGVIKQHRTIGTYVNMLLQLGFSLARVEEWRPTDEQVAARPDLAEERERPMFLLISAVRG